MVNSCEFHLLCPAKINILLNITGRRDDGFHNLKSIFAKISLYDNISGYISHSAAPDFICRSNHDELNRVPVEKQLIYRAFSAFYNELKIELPGVSLYLHKNIPIGAGLGGGSSDAASILLFLNQLHGNPFSASELNLLAQQVGMDLPFFLEADWAVVEQRGEKISPFDQIKPLYGVLVWPEVMIPTALAYQQFKGYPFQMVLNSFDDVITSLRNRDDSVFDLLGYNDFEQTLFPLYPELKKLKEEIASFQPLMALMSGSGSSIYGLFREKEDAILSFLQLRKKYKNTFLFRTL